MMRIVVDKLTGEITEYTDAQFITIRDNLLFDWEASKKALELAKEKEMTLRKKIVELSFDPEKEKGTERIPLGNGYELKAVKKINYGFVKKDDGKTDIDKIDDALDRIAALGNDGPFIAERLVKFTPDLSVSEYNKLSPHHKTIIDAVIVTSEGAPTLEIIEPKGK